MSQNPQDNSFERSLQVVTEANLWHQTNCHFLWRPSRRKLKFVKNF